MMHYCCVFHVLHPHHLVRIAHGGRRAGEFFLVVVLRFVGSLLFSFWCPHVSLFNPPSPFSFWLPLFARNREGFCGISRCFVLVPWSQNTAFLLITAGFVFVSSWWWFVGGVYGGVTVFVCNRMFVRASSLFVFARFFVVGWLVRLCLQWFRVCFQRLVVLDFGLLVVWEWCSSLLVAV